MKLEYDISDNLRSLRQLFQVTKKIVHSKLVVPKRIIFLNLNIATLKDWTEKERGIAIEMFVFKVLWHFFQVGDSSLLINLIMVSLFADWNNSIGK